MFNSVRIKKPVKSKFDLTHEKKFSGRMGKLIPIMAQEVLPGDKFSVSSELFIRFAPMLAPIMHRVNATIHYFFVPNRLVWDEWEDFITKGRLGTSAPVAPYLPLVEATKAASVKGSLMDFMGVPDLSAGTFGANEIRVSALPFRAYQLVYDEYYRDQNLTASLDISKASGSVGTTTEFDKLTAMRIRAWEKDRFTSALPFTQRGSDVLIPMEGVADSADIDYSTQSSYLPTPAATGDISVLGPGAGVGTLHVNGEGAGRIENIDSITFSNATITINDLRRAARLQEWLEKNAVAGGRYVEQLKVHFNVKSSDARLQRPEYLGGGKAPVVISEVLSTATDSDIETIPPQGNMSGHGVAVGHSNRFRRFFEEHGHIIAMLSVLPRTAYQQGLPKHLQRFDPFDYAFPEFANIGEEPILKRELMIDFADFAAYDEVFGYQSRYSEYKYSPSTVHGDFKDTLNFWHMGRIFESPPSLETPFIEADPTDRIFAVTDVDNMYCQILNKVHAIRPLPYFGTPML